MKQKRQKTSIKKYLLLGASLVVLAIGVALVLEATHTIHLFSKKNEFTANQKKEAATDRQTKKDFTQGTSSSNQKANNNDTGITPTPSNVTLTASESLGNVVIQTKLTGYSGGSCDLLVTNGSKTYTQTVAIIYQSEFSTCAGFTVPVSQLGSGNWSIKVTATTGATSETGTTSLEVK